MELLQWVHASPEFMTRGGPCGPMRRGDWAPGGHDGGAPSAWDGGGPDEAVSPLLLDYYSTIT